MPPILASFTQVRLGRQELSLQTAALLTCISVMMCTLTIAEVRSSRYKYVTAVICLAAARFAGQIMLDPYAPLVIDVRLPDNVQVNRCRKWMSFRMEAVLLCFPPYTGIPYPDIKPSPKSDLPRNDNNLASGID